MPQAVLSSPNCPHCSVATRDMMRHLPTHNEDKALTMNMGGYRVTLTTARGGWRCVLCEFVGLPLDLHKHFQVHCYGQTTSNDVFALSTPGTKRQSMDDGHSCIGPTVKRRRETPNGIERGRTPTIDSRLTDRGNGILSPYLTPVSSRSGINVGGAAGHSAQVLDKFQIDEMGTPTPCLKDAVQKGDLLPSSQSTVPSSPIAQIQSPSCSGEKGASTPSQSAASDTAPTTATPDVTTITDEDKSTMPPLEERLSMLAAFLNANKGSCVMHALFPSQTQSTPHTNLFYCDLINVGKDSDFKNYFRPALRRSKKFNIYCNSCGCPRHDAFDHAVEDNGRRCADDNMQDWIFGLAYLIWRFKGLRRNVMRLLGEGRVFDGKQGCCEFAEWLTQRTDDKVGTNMVDMMYVWAMNVDVLTNGIELTQIDNCEE
ncbi:hypothetical protein BJ138DRAFT_1103050 [Hygrophoropsis aurantiaca]|uniref:Uncharacterized protein n=1 Tax=Hygrophoropsis aurantiaca TaxID=72124 RepID=A0ACB8A7E7_9AGAM|nr:hypothetical protein BJ138DRAFT_1103050 [Hygrophoropsis aurantiaca]